MTLTPSVLKYPRDRRTSCDTRYARDGSADVPGQPHWLSRPRAPVRRRDRGAGRKHARQRFEALDDVALIGPGAIVREAHEARPEPDDGHAIRVEARAAVEHEEAANEQAARAEQQHRQCDLHDDQPFAHDRARPAGAGRSLFHGKAHIGPRGLKCRRDPGRHAGEQGDAEADQRDPRIQRQVEVVECTTLAALPSPRRRSAAPPPLQRPPASRTRPGAGGSAGRGWRRSRGEPQSLSGVAGRAPAGAPRRLPRPPAKPVRPPRRAAEQSERSPPALETGRREPGEPRRRVP